MTVFVSRVRRAYVRRRNIREMAAFVVLIVLILAAYVAASWDEWQAERMDALTREQRAAVVARW